MDGCGNCVGGTTGENPCATVEEYDFLNLSAQSEGDTLDENVIVGVDEDTGEKWISGHTADGRLTIEPIALSDEFELTVKVKVTSYSNSPDIFLVSGEDRIRLEFEDVSASLNGASGGTSWRGFDVNTMRLHVNGNIAKLYVNDVFYHKVTLDKGDLTYTSLAINDIATTTRIYELKGRNLERSSSPPVEDCAGVMGGSAYIDACGDCVGGTTGLPPCVTEVIWDADENKKWSLPDIIYGLQVLSGVR